MHVVNVPILLPGKDASGNAGKGIIEHKRRERQQSGQEV